MIVLISDFDLRGSGYMNIAIALCSELASRGHRVLALGIGYSGAEHHWPFSILPLDTRQAFVHIPAYIQNLRALSQSGQMPPLEALIVALDVPLQERLLMMEERKGIPYVGIFPIESGPLCQSWANVVAAMDAPLVISKFGLTQMEEAGIKGTYLPVGIDSAAWRRPTAKERAKLRASMGYTDEQVVVLTVADNQERKNLSAGMDIIAKASKDVDVQWMLVTRVHSPVGWKLDDMAIQKGVMDRIAKFERGLPFERLWMLYAIADVFLLPSKAEGLCMPILEAMAAGVPVAATDCTAVPEHLFRDVAARDGLRGFPLRGAFFHQDPWGNSVRTYVDSDHGAEVIREIAALKRDDPEGRLLRIIEEGRAYAERRTWKLTGDVLDETVRRVRKAPEPPPAMASGTKQPATIPSLIPIAEEDRDEQA